MIAFKNGDMFTSDAPYLCHQVNCMGRMGSGIAKTVREKFPNAYKAYMNLCQSDGVTPDDLLGTAQFVECGTQTIVNLFAQRNYGYDGALYTNYEAFRNCLRNIKESAHLGTTIAFPNGIGCGLGGAKWETILGMIKEELADDYEVEVWKYGGE